MNNKCLAEYVLNLYDYHLVKNKIKEVFDLFDYLDRTEDGIILPNITSGGNVRYEQFLPEITSSKVESFVFSKITLEIRGSDYKQRKLLSKIKIALDKLNKDERRVFKYSFYEDKDINFLCDKLHYCERKIKSIKKSASIKFLMALGIDYLCYKGGDKFRKQTYFQDKARGFV